MSKEIPLTQGKFAIVDDCNYEWLTQWKWYAVCTGKLKMWYVARVENHKTILMHREILGAKKGQITDHKNHNGFDNRLANIRLCSYSENAQNRMPYKNSTNKHKGVSWHKVGGKWQVKITVNNKRIQLGYCKNEIEAAKMYDKAALKYFGKFAYTNSQVFKE